MRSALAGAIECERNDFVAAVRRIRASKAFASCRSVAP